MSVELDHYEDYRLPPNDGDNGTTHPKSHCGAFHGNSNDCEHKGVEGARADREVFKALREYDYMTGGDPLTYPHTAELVEPKKEMRWKSISDTNDAFASPKLGRHGSMQKAASLLRPCRMGVLSNPLSGGNRNGRGAVRETSSVLSQICRREVQNKADVASALADFARQEVDVVAVDGGDGTVHAVLTALFRHQMFETPPLLALLRSGTANMIARDVGLRGRHDQALRRLYTWVRSGDNHAVILERPVLRVQVPSCSDPLYGMFLGAAGLYQGTLFCRRKVHRLGIGGEVAPGITFALSFLAASRGNREYLAPVPITVGLDRNPPEQGNWLLLLISTLERLIFGIRPYWDAENGPLHFTGVGANPKKLWQALPSGLRGRKSRHIKPEYGYVSANAHEVQLNLDSGFTLDGELYAPDSRLGPVVVQDGGLVSFLRL